MPLPDWDAEFVRRQREYAIEARRRVVDFLAVQPSPATPEQIGDALDLDVELVALLLTGAGELLDQGAVRRESDGFALIGAARLVTGPDLRHRIDHALCERHSPVTVDDLASQAGGDVSDVQRVLDEMTSSGAVEQKGGHYVLAFDPRRVARGE